MTDGHGAGLLRVVNEVGLNLVIGGVTDNLDGVLIGTDRTIRAETIEHGGIAFARHLEGRIVIEAGAGHVVVDAEGEVVLRLGLSQVIEHSLDQSRSELFRTETVTAADDGRVVDQIDQPVAHSFTDGGADVLVERLTEGTRLLGPIKHGNFLDRSRERLGQGLGRQRHEQADLEQTDLLALRDQIVDQFMGGIATGTHHDDNPLGVGSADIVNQVVLTTGKCSKLVHLRLHNTWDRIIIFIDCFTTLEIYIRVLRGAAQLGTFRRQATLAVGANQFVVHHVTHVVECQLLDLLNLVGGTEAVKKMQERHPRLQSRRLGDEGEVHDLLNIIGGQESPASGPAGHDVGMIAKNGQGLASQSTSRNMEYGRGQLTGNFVHARDHQQQTLRGSKGGGQSTGLQCTVDRAGSAAFGLHFHHIGNGVPDVLFSSRALKVGDFAHIGRGGNGVDCDDFVGGMCNMCRCRITVSANHLA